MRNYITKACCVTTAWFGRFSARTSLQTAANARRYVNMRKGMKSIYFILFLFICGCANSPHEPIKVQTKAGDGAPNFDMNFMRKKMAEMQAMSINTKYKNKKCNKIDGIVQAVSMSPEDYCKNALFGCSETRKPKTRLYCMGTSISDCYENKLWLTENPGLKFAKEIPYKKHTSSTERIDGNLVSNVCVFW
jgi:hypothetical protein